MATLSESTKTGTNRITAWPPSPLLRFAKATFGVHAAEDCPKKGCGAGAYDKKAGATGYVSCVLSLPQNSQFKRLRSYNGCLITLSFV
jgi:hypothetical protein